MATWIPAKATPPELKYNAKNKAYRQQCCRICGKTVFTGSICGSCKRFIDIKKREEGASDHGKHRS